MPARKATEMTTNPTAPRRSSPSIGDTRPDPSGKGYVEEYNPDHLLTRQTGWVLQHRSVLYDACGSSDQPCYWCGHCIPWKTGNWKTSVNVDHLNEDRTDNRLTNLVPSCWWCNVNRSWSRIAPRTWHRARCTFSDLPPQERPNMIFWLAQWAEIGVTGELPIGHNSDLLAPIFHDNDTTWTPATISPPDIYEEP